MYHNRHINNYYIISRNTLDELSLALYLRIAEHIGVICMVFFFFMSAFWFYNGLNNNKEVLIKWKKRIKTLLVPFIIWSIIIAIYKVSISDIVLNKDNIFYYFFISPIGRPLWYILGLLILQLFSPIIISLKKRKNIIKISFSLIIIYIFLRCINIIPPFLSFELWWWYDVLIYYIPIYLIGAYIGMYHPDILLKKEYNEKIHTYIGILLLTISFNALSIIKQSNLMITILFSIIYLIGFWLILKPKYFQKKISDFFNCNFYIYALHFSILIPKTDELITQLLHNQILYNIELVLIKIIQIFIIVLISAIIRKIVTKIFPKQVDYCLTGGRQ